MKIACKKCQHQLTRRSLYPAKDWFVGSRTVEVIDDGEGEPYNFDRTELSVPIGSFLVERSAIWLPKGEKPRFFVNPADVAAGLIPLFKVGGGCCNWYCLELNCPSCGAEVGEANLDCHQHKHVSFEESMVIRTYKQ